MFIVFYLHTNTKKELNIMPLLLNKFPLFLGVVLFIIPVAVFAEGETFKLSIKDHRFEPAKLEVPANTKFKLEITNLDATPEEFESHSLSREKIIPGGATVSMFVGPVVTGEYEFFGEFNPSTAKGMIVALENSADSIKK